MRIILKIFIFLLPILFCNCKRSFEPTESNTNQKEVNLPVSDSAQIPKINAMIGIESGEIAIIWEACIDARRYELEKTNPTGGWDIIYSGTELSYGVGIIPNGVSISFRVRAVYATFVSNWSDPVTV